MPLQATQDLEARFAIFLNPIKDLTKNWEVDIAKYLEEYLVELSEVPITFDGGETTMNFAEAAMLIQGSTAVYSKKVEFLWQMVLQMLDLLSSKRNLESARNEHPKSGEGGKHKSHEVNLDFTETNNLTVGKSINMKEDDQESCERFKFLPAMPLHLVDKEGEKSQMRIALYLKNMESFGNKEDFRINRSYLTPVGLLCLDLPPEILKRRLTIIREVPISLNDSIAGFLNPNDGNMPQVPQNEKFNEVGSPENIEPVEDDNIDFMDHNDDEIDPIANFSSDEIVPEVEKESNEKLEVTIGRNGLRRRGQKEKIENVAKQKVTLPLKPRDPHVETPAKRPIRSGRIRKPMPCLCHKETRQEKKKSKLEKEAEQKKGIESVENYIAKDLANFINNNVHKDKLEDAALNPQLSNGLTQHDDLIKRKKKGQEGMNKEPSSPTHTEEEVERREEEKNQDHADFDEIPDLDLDNVGCDDDDIPLPQPHQDTNFFALNGLVGANSSKLNESMFDEPETNYEALVQKLVSDYITSAQEYIASSELTKRVNKWKQMIMPKLEEEEERKVFDIHDYGSYILECFPQNSSNTNTTTADNVSFDKIVTNRSPREVSRIFLSCLMLANTYNVDLAESRDGDLEMDCLELKLLSRVRHHKRLEEFGPTSPRVKKKRKSNSEKRKKLSNEEDFVIGQEEIIANERLEEFGPTSPHEKKKRKSNSEKRKKEEDFVIGQEDLIANEKEVLYSQKLKFKRAKTNNNSIDR